MDGEFTPITTKEAFESAVSDRVKSACDDVRKQFADYETIKAAGKELQGKLTSAQADLAEAQKKAGESETAYKKQIADLEGKIRGFESDRLKAEKALEYGLPYALHGRLTGDTAEAIEADAKAMAELLRKQNGNPPPMQREDTPGKYSNETAKDAVLRMFTEKLINRNGG